MWMFLFLLTVGDWILPKGNVMLIIIVSIKIYIWLYFM